MNIHQNNAPVPKTNAALTPAFSSDEFRRALGLFATGVTIVTARAPNGDLVGLTANSFNSVSLAPPLVLWSLALKAGALPVFAAGSHYAVNVLAADQMHLAIQFASRTDNKFAGVAYTTGVAGAPILDGAAATFECFNRSQYTEGDHIIFVGEVEQCACTPDASPLLYHGGKFYTEHPLQATFEANAGQQISSANGDGLRGNSSAPAFVSNYLGYLLGQASHAVYADFEPAVSGQGLSHIEWRVLAVLADAPQGEPLTRLAHLILAKQPTTTKLTQRMANAGLLELRPDALDQRKTVVHITHLGAGKAKWLTEAAAVHEADRLSSLSAGEIATFKGLLARLGGS